MQLGVRFLLVPGLLALCLAGCGSTPAGPCTYQVTPAAQTIAAGGGSATLTIVAAGGCSWNASSSATWLQLTGLTSGTGGGSLTITVAANNTIDARNGSVSAGGSTATITQNGITPGNCGGAYTISPAARSSTAAGGVFLVAVTAAAGCAWTYTSNVGWITLAPPSPGMNPGVMPGTMNLAGGGVGPGTVEVTVAANTGATARTGTATIAGQTLTITQDGTASAVCAYSVSPGTLNFNAAGGSAVVTITTTANCSWNLDVSAAAEDWVHGYRGVRGTGTSTISLTADPNGSMTSRSGAIWIYPDSNGDRVPIMVNQAAATCLYAVAPTQASFTASGGQAWLSVSTTPAGCSWQATSSAWITIVSGPSGAGSGTVTYSVAANPGAARSGSVVVAGLSGVNPPATQQVTQAAAAIR
jgi:hypothetical protein